MENEKYDRRYARDAYYWGVKPSPICYRVLQLMPPERNLRLIDIGCGEGRNAVFFARNGYDVTAFDTSPVGLKKANRLADEVGVKIKVFEGDINMHRLTDKYDIIFSTGVLQYIPPDQRRIMIDHYQEQTVSGGLNVHSIIVRKPFIPRASDAEKSAYKWVSGEILKYYHEWKIEFINEGIFNCNSGGVPHQHAINRVIARKVEGV